MYHQLQTSYAYRRGEHHLNSPSSPCSTGCVFGSHHAANRFTPSPTPREEHNLFESSPFPHDDAHSTIDRRTLAELISKYGGPASSAWIDGDQRYKLWCPSQPIPESSFTPVQGYIRHDPYISAWGNPLVSSPAALEKTARAFIAFAESQHLRPLWACVDHDLEAILSSFELGWVTLSCTYEDFIDPAELLDLASLEHKGKEGAGKVHDLTHNLRKADMGHVFVHEVKGGWKVDDQTAVTQGVQAWKSHRNRMSVDPVDFDPWAGQEHRRHWVAKVGEKIVGVLVLTPLSPTHWQIIKCIPFDHSPKGTSERLIHTAVKDLYEEKKVEAIRFTLSPPAVPEDAEHEAIPQNRIKVSFGISPAQHLEPVHNMGSWRVNILSMTYATVAGVMGLEGVAEYRKKFNAKKEPLFICYPADGMGIVSASALLVALRPV